MNFDYEISMREDLITIIPFSESETEISTDNFDINIADFWKYIEEEELNHYCSDYPDPSEFYGHGQDVGIMDFDEYFDLDYFVIKKDLLKYLIASKKF